MQITDHPTPGHSPAPWVSPRPVCGACNGNTGKTINGHWVACTTCTGTGLANR